MNLLDLAILAVFAVFILLGYYKGFLSTLMSIVGYIIAWVLALVLIPMGSNLVKGNDNLFNMMLYYTEGSEYVTEVEVARLEIDSVSMDELSTIIANAELPYPMAKHISANISGEVFLAEGVTSVGDYFNQTIVCVFINITVFLIIFAALRIILAFVINGVDYAWRFPVLRRGDGLLAALLGLVRGILTLFLVFMLVPMMLVVLGGKFELIETMLENSFFAHFFYNSNFLLGMMPGV